MTHTQQAQPATVAQLLASLSSIPPSEAPLIGKLHAWVDGERVFFVWDGSAYRVREEAAA